MITERQEQLLNTIIQEYINSAQPVSSQLLEKKYEFGIKPAMIRIEMQKLADQGFLYQPHTSAGRVPTDRGYRFFVDNLVQSDFNQKFFWDEFEEIEKEIKDVFKFTQFITKSLASASSNLALSYLFERDFLLEEGWGEVFQEPEFRDSDFCSRFIKMVESFEKEIRTLPSARTLKVWPILKNLDFENLLLPKIYIGKENPFPKAKDFSIIISKCRFPKKQEGMLAILGPKRMAYQRNISLINSIVKSLEKY